MPGLRNEDRAGLYITVIVHLAVIIVLLAVRIGGELGKENTFLLDFTKQEEMEKEAAEQQKDEQIRQQVSQRLDEILGSIPVHSVHNVAVDRSAPLKDDRNTDADQLYKDAERLAQELKNGQNAIKEDAREETVDLTPSKPETAEKSKPSSYSGPSVVSYSLDGRKATHLPIPAYRCMGGGYVTVIITVNNDGMVVGATVQDDVSEKDQCLRNYAIRAARLSKFSKSSTAPANQKGDITYCFIAQ